jgi:RNA polymerase sigma-70 factor (ECF subfamily)
MLEVFADTLLVMERSDSELLVATAAGDADAFAALFRRHEASVTRYAVRRCSSPSEVADAVAETFLAALRSAHRHRGESADALPWLFGIARNVVFEQVRAERRRMGLRLRAQAATPRYASEEYERVLDALEASDRAGRLSAALKELPRGERAVFDLVTYADLTPAQAAEALGITPNAARVRLSRARRRLQDADANFNPEANCA